LNPSRNAMAGAGGIWTPGRSLVNRGGRRRFLADRSLPFDGLATCVCRAPGDRLYGRL